MKNISRELLDLMIKAKLDEIDLHIDMGVRVSVIYGEFELVDEMITTRNLLSTGSGKVGERGSFESKNII